MKAKTLILLALLMFTATAAAAQIVDMDSLKVFAIKDAADIKDTCTTWGESGRGFSAGDTLTTDNPDLMSAAFEQIALSFNPEILVGGASLLYYLGGTVSPGSDSAAVYTGPGVTYADVALDACSTATCTTFINTIIEDSTSYDDSCTGYLCFDQSNSVERDTVAFGRWEPFDSTLFTASDTWIDLTIYPTKRYWRVRAHGTTATEDSDTLYVVGHARRGRPRSLTSGGFFAAPPDWLGLFDLDSNEAAAGFFTDTISTWPLNGIDHLAGDKLTCTYFGSDEGFYNKLLTQIRALPTQSSDECSTTCFFVVDQSMDGWLWFPSDSTIIPGADTTVHVDTLDFIHRMPYWRSRTAPRDSSDQTTPMLWELLAQRLK